MVLEGGWAFVVEPLDDRHMRVILRGRKARGWPAVYDLLLIELPHFLMERKMLLGIKERAEREALTRSSSSEKGCSAE